jgi:hypothetical protein
LPTTAGTGDYFGLLYSPGYLPANPHLAGYIDGSRTWYGATFSIVLDAAGSVPVVSGLARLMGRVGSGLRALGGAGPTPNLLKPKLSSAIADEGAGSNGLGPKPNNLPGPGQIKAPNPAAPKGVSITSDLASKAGGKTRPELIADLEKAGLKIKGQSPDGRFMEFVDDCGRVRAKIHPPDKATPTHHLHLYDEAGNPLDVALNPVLPTSPAAHIPVKAP